MRRIRIGKDIIIRWTVTTNGEPDPLHGRILKLMLHHAFMPDMEIPFSVDKSISNRIVATFRGVSQESIGTYRLTLWENYGLDGQTVVDYCNAFELVNTTCEEGGEDVEGLDTETVELEGSDIETGIPGADGMSAYELFKKYNPDSPLTEQEYAEAPIEAAGSANAAARSANTAAGKADTAANRADALADNPPKIIEVEGAKYWAFWDEATGQYVPSENRADVGDAVLFSPQTLTPQQQEQARANIGAFAKGQFGGPQYYAIDTSLFPQISAFKPEDTIYDDETDTIYSILNFPVNLLVAVKNLKVVKAHTYRMIYERNDSSIVLIGDYIYATIGGDMTFLRRINKETLEEELAVSYTGLIDGTVGCGLYVAGDKLFLRAKDNILYLVDKEELTISDTGFHDVTTICNVTKDVIAFADGSNIYLYDGESVINQINIPAEYSDIKYLNNYRGKYTAYDLKYLIASVNNAQYLLYIDIVESRFIKGSTQLISGVESKFVGYKRIFNLHNTDYMCIASKDSNLAGICNYVLNRPWITGIFQTGFYLIDAFLYGDKDIYCTYGGYFMR